jgi:hypothetical protein
LLIALTCCEGCKKDDPKPLTELEKLPAATQVGKNTFGCLVNGKAWVPKSSSDFQAVSQGFLQIGATLNLEAGQFQIIGITANFPLADNEKFDLASTKESTADFSVFSNNKLCEYKPSDTFWGNLLINKIDFQRYIISGTFEFSTVTSGCDTMKITNGRFDQRYIP